MKEVVTVSQQPTISFQEVDPDKFYGVERWDTKGFITRPYYNHGDYQARSLHKLTIGNCFSIHGEANLGKFVKKLVESPNTKVFEFETAQELMSWLAE